MTEMHGPERNWAGNYTYRAQKLHRPTTMEQVQEIVANAASVHVLGSRHSFNDIADSWELISLENLPADVVVDHEAQRVSFGGRMNPTELRVTSSARLQQRLIGTRSSNWIRPLVRRSWAGPVSGSTAYRISAWVTHRAAAKKSSRSTCSRVGMPWEP